MAGTGEHGQGIARVTRSKLDAKKAYDRLSRWYDLISARSERKPREAGLAMLAAREGERVLEVGFGTGNALLTLAMAVGETGGVTGLDISDGMREVARRKLEGRGLMRRVRLDTGDAASLPYPDGSFDAVFMSFTLELFDTPEIPVVLEQCRRVLRDCGRACVVSMSDSGRRGAMAKLYLWAHSRFPAYVDCRPINVPRAVVDTGFEVLEERAFSVWGLPVEAVLAKNAGGEKVDKAGTR